MAMVKIYNKKRCEKFTAFLYTYEKLFGQGFLMLKVVFDKMLWCRKQRRQPRRRRRKSFHFSAVDEFKLYG